MVRKRVQKATKVNREDVVRQNMSKIATEDTDSDTEASDSSSEEDPDETDNFIFQSGYVCNC